MYNKKNPYKKYQSVEKYKKKELSVKISAKWLVIVESPSKCSKIESFLGSEYQCIASKGHLRTIENLKSIDIAANFEIDFSLIEEKQSHIESMKKIVSQFPKQNILIATDDDREGEAIGWHLCVLFDLDIAHTKRIIFREITKSAISVAVQNPTTLNMPLIQAQNCRQVLDMIVGYKISPILWKYVYYNNKNSLSAGRCQTPALRLVYDKDAECKNREQIQIYKTSASFFSMNEGILFELNKEFERKEEIEEFLSESVDFSYKLKVESPQAKITSPPKPFNTSHLLQRISSQLHYSPKDAMTLCQQLYQEGHITYMRTDSTKYSETFLREARDYIKGTYTDKYLGNLSNIQNIDTINPHEAVRVTHIDMRTVDTDNPKLNQVYKLIWQNTLESCMSDYEYISRPIVITAPREYSYRHCIEIPRFLGWKTVKNARDSKIEESLVFYLQTLEKTQKFTYNYIQSKVSVKNIDRHFTEATLIKELEDKGIGRPSTFAFIIDTIQDRGYVKKVDIEGRKYSITEFKLRGDTIEIEESEKVFGNEKNKLVIQNIGIIVCEFLVEHFGDLFSYDYTKRLEVELDEIATCKRDPWYETCRNCIDGIDSLLSSLNIQKKEYRIDDNHILIFGKNGPVIKNINEADKFISVKRELKIDIEALKAGKYTLEELVDVKERNLGKYENADIILKSGRFGYYIEWQDSEQKQSVEEILKRTKKTADNLSISDIIELINPSRENDSNSSTILRELSANLSIRKGKYGAYIYYKTPSMKKPEFYNIKKFRGSFTFCEKETLVEWLNTTYKVVLS